MRLRQYCTIVHDSQTHRFAFRCCRSATPASPSPSTAKSECSFPVTVRVARVPHSHAALYSVYDLLGCAYNMPAAYEDKVFESCEGEVQDVVGLYTVAGGVTTSWAQPRDLDPSTTLPYTPRVPASSNCKTYQSTEILGVSADALRSRHLSR